MTASQAALPSADSAASRSRVVISFSGLDGAGKTFQIDSLVDGVRSRGETCEVLWIPFKIWPEPLLNRIPARWRSRLGPQRRPTPAGEPAAPPAQPGPVTRAMRRVARWVWTAVALMASVSAGLSLRRRVAASTSDVLVLDRYRLDSIVKLQYWYADVAPPLLAAVVRRLAPAPDLEILLRVDGEVAYARKPEQWSAAQLTRQARLYDAAVAGQGVLVLDGTRPPESIAAEIESHLHAMLDR